MPYIEKGCFILKDGQMFEVTSVGSGEVYIGEPMKQITNCILTNDEEFAKLLCLEFDIPQDSGTTFVTSRNEFLVLKKEIKTAMKDGLMNNWQLPYRIIMSPEFIPLVADCDAEFLTFKPMFEAVGKDALSKGQDALTGWSRWIEISKPTADRLKQTLLLQKIEHRALDITAKNWLLDELEKSE